MVQVTLDRLENQITWYDTRSGYCQKMYKGLKLAELIAAAGVPLFAGLAQNAWITGALGAAVVVLEGVQHLNQYHTNWMSYRSTAEALKHEKYLHAAKAGPYVVSDAPDALLAERVEGLISQEHAKWVTQREQKKSDARP
jgi:Protein of unknown function (DUF4231)